MDCNSAGSVENTQHSGLRNLSSPLLRHIFSFLEACELRLALEASRGLLTAARDVPEGEVILYARAEDDEEGTPTWVMRQAALASLLGRAEEILWVGIPSDAADDGQRAMLLSTLLGGHGRHLKRVRNGGRDLSLIAEAVAAGALPALSELALDLCPSGAPCYCPNALEAALKAGDVGLEAWEVGYRYAPDHPFNKALAALAGGVCPGLTKLILWDMWSKTAVDALAEAMEARGELKSCVPIKELQSHRESYAHDCSWEQDLFDRDFSAVLQRLLLSKACRSLESINLGSVVGWTSAILSYLTQGRAYKLRSVELSFDHGDVPAIMGAFAAGAAPALERLSLYLGYAELSVETLHKLAEAIQTGAWSSLRHLTLYGYPHPGAVAVMDAITRGGGYPQVTTLEVRTYKPMALALCQGAFPMLRTLICGKDGTMVAIMAASDGTSLTNIRRIDVESKKDANAVADAMARGALPGLENLCIRYPFSCDIRLPDVLRQGRGASLREITCGVRGGEEGVLSALLQALADGCCPAFSRLHVNLHVQRGGLAQSVRAVAWMLRGCPSWLRAVTQLSFYRSGYPYHDDYLSEKGPVRCSRCLWRRGGGVCCPADTTLEWEDRFLGVDFDKESDDDCDSGDDEEDEEEETEEEEEEEV